MPKSHPPAHRTSTLARDAEALHAAVTELVRVYQFRDRDRICCHDISVTQCHALETLVECGPLRLSALAQRLFLDKSTTSRVAATLERKGYVEHEADASDGRVTVLSATRRGRTLCARINTELVGQQRVLLEDLEPAIRSGVVDVIQRLARSADARFRSGVSVGAGGACCTTDTGATACG